MEKVAQYESVFKQFDGNGDRNISPMELQQCVRAIGGKLSLTEVEVVVEYLDSDGDGLLGLDEFVKFVDRGWDELEGKAFKMYAMDRSESVTPKSFKRMLSRLGESKSVDKYKNMIARFDLNGDGVLNFDKFKVMMF